MDTRPPLDLREVFAQPWTGSATVERPRWLRWLPIADRFDFSTETTDVELAETTGLLVRDTTTFPNGRTWVRTMRARMIAPDRWRVSARDMPGGAEQLVTADGFRFTRYTILAPVLGPIRLPLRCDDEVRLVDPRTMIDTLELRFLGVRVGTVTIRVVQAPAVPRNENTF